MNVNGKKILITGGGSGIGLELARRLAGANAVAAQCPADREQRATRQEAGRTARRCSGLVLADVGELGAAGAHEIVRCNANRLFVRTRLEHE
jgi:NAD(P)-dependent dehydrogenase (short-subunit alcohol dehydrogenase family)